MVKKSVNKLSMHIQKSKWKDVLWEKQIRRERGCIAMFSLSVHVSSNLTCIFTYWILVLYPIYWIYMHPTLLYLTATQNMETLWDGMERMRSLNSKKVLFGPFFYPITLCQRQESCFVLNVDGVEIRYKVFPITIKLIWCLCKIPLMVYVFVKLTN